MVGANPPGRRNHSGATSPHHRSLILREELCRGAPLLTHGLRYATVPVEGFGGFSEIASQSALGPSPRCMCMRRTGAQTATRNQDLMLIAQMTPIAQKLLARERSSRQREELGEQPLGTLRLETKCYGASADLCPSRHAERCSGVSARTRTHQRRNGCRTLTYDTPMH